ncbi:MAG: hypothetical protein ACTSUV_00875 [Candidatus Ranarchaeia archaeon]
MNNNKSSEVKKKELKQISKIPFIFLIFGFIFTLLDLNIRFKIPNSILYMELLFPDFIGYLGIAIGLHLLAPYLSIFKKGRTISLLLVVLSLFAFSSVSYQPLVSGVGLVT